MSIRDALRKLWRKTDPLKVNPLVADHAYLKQGDVVQSVGVESVASAAGVLESALVMSEDLAEDSKIALLLTKKELNSFVCYMRQLDTAYREQGKFVAKHIKFSEPGSHTHELKTIEEIAQVSPERYEQLTGQSARQAAPGECGE